jgi:CubicO group peptidase (beta-lactamase class C family)
MVSAAALAFATTLAASGPTLEARLDPVIDRAIAEQRIVGAVVLVAVDGKVVYQRAAGHADRESGRAMRRDDVFRLASVTKPIVSAAAMRLVERRDLSLDDPVTRWLPDFRPQMADGSRPTITVRHLITHTSGLSYRLMEPPGSAYDRLNVSDGLDQPGLSFDENLRRLGQAPLAYRPGTAWRYSLSMDVLGAVIERAAGKPLPEVVRETVTAPLRLKRTGFTAERAEDLVTPYFNAEPGPKRMFDGVAVPIGGAAARFAPSRALDARSYPSGGAGMVASANDVLTFLEAIRKGGAPILSPATVRAMTSDQVGPQAQTQGPGWGFGYGWAVLADPAAAKTPQSAGTFQWGGAYGHSWFVDPARRITVVAMTNTAFEGMNGRFTTELRDAVYAAAP